MYSEERKIEDLMVDYFSGTLSEKDQLRLFDLIAFNEELKSKFDEMARTRAILHIPAIESEKEANYKKIWEQMEEKTTSSRKNLRLWFSTIGKIAAVFIFLVTVSLALFHIYKDGTTPAGNRMVYETFSPAGSQTKILLPDSTLVWLNSGSSLKYNQEFGTKNREVELSGEAYFEVSKKMDKHFIVHTSMLDIMDVGTVFNIKSYEEDNEIVVSLIEGALNISLPDDKTNALWSVKPDEEFVFNKLTKKNSSKKTDSSYAAQWINSKLYFVDTSIEQITKDLERRYNVKINIASEKMKGEIFSGSLDLNLPLKENLSYMDVDKKMKISQYADTIYITTK